MDRDWKVAKAWFEDALNRDPNNAGLKRLVAFVDQPPDGKTQAPSPSRNLVPAQQTPPPTNARVGKMSTEQVIEEQAQIIKDQQRIIEDMLFAEFYKNVKLRQ